MDRFDLFINDLESFIKFALERAGFGSAVLFGHSMGGLIVLHYLGRVGKGMHASVGLRLLWRLVVGRGSYYRC